MNKMGTLNKKITLKIYKNSKNHPKINRVKINILKFSKKIYKYNKRINR